MKEIRKGRHDRSPVAVSISEPSEVRPRKQSVSQSVLNRVIYNFVRVCPKQTGFIISCGKKKQ